VVCLSHKINSSRKLYKNKLPHPLAPSPSQERGGQHLNISPPLHRGGDGGGV